MKTAILRGALALPLATILGLTAQPLLADQPAQADIIAAGFRPDAHGPAGTMADHVHKRGDLMIGLMWMHEDYGGSNRSGTDAIDDSAIAAAGYASKSDAMTMDMAMLHVMYAPSDWVTLMLVPSWMRMGMTMKGLPVVAGSSAMHMLMPGQTMDHSVKGLGDTQFGALVALSRRPELSAHAGLMISAPTGDATRKSASGSYVHYMMQGGSGTWDINPSFTLHGTTSAFGWGAQASYLFRAQKENDAGFRFGDRFAATAWLSKPVSDKLSLSTRLAWSSEQAVSGHYNSTHSHASPPDRQANYGGDRLEGGLGFNALVGKRLRIGGEISTPLYQNLNGIQLPKRWGANISTAVMF